MNRGARLILVRHGETEGESSIRYHGRNDVPLSEPGRAQMRLASRAIETRRGGGTFARVFSSPLVRASEGARIVTNASAPLVTIDEFVE
ncbi:MAG TPA: phosphoglycerate mutase family protein, partial [Candidatus Acidoferrales bacterium]|nr:phosphoglycerate mutase family protein [Candidatus Acidoferrales bacterium]